MICRAICTYLEEDRHLLQAVIAPNSTKSSTSTLRHFLKAGTDLLELEAEEPQTATEAYRLRVAILEQNVLVKLLMSLADVDFEERKDSVRFFAAFLRGGAATDRVLPEIVDYVRSQSELPGLLLKGCAQPDMAMHFNEILRALASCSELVGFELLESRMAHGLMELATNQNFDISSDAFASLRTLLLSQKKVAAVYLQQNFEEMFEEFHSHLLLCEVGHAKHCASFQYTIRRQALRLLAEMLLDANFSKVMQQYAANDCFLKIIMNLMLDPSKHIKLGAFHVFKIFVANPRKPTTIAKILCRNRERLIELLHELSSLFALEGSNQKAAQENEALHNDLQDVMRLLPSQGPPCNHQFGLATSKGSTTSCSSECSSPRSQGSDTSTTAASTPSQELEP
jgi:calcium binding protein 39